MFNLDEFEKCKDRYIDPNGDIALNFINRFGCPINRHFIPLANSKSAKVFLKKLKKDKEINKFVVYEMDENGDETLALTRDENTVSVWTPVFGSLNEARDFGIRFMKFLAKHHPNKERVMLCTSELNPDAYGETIH